MDERQELMKLIQRVARNPMEKVVFIQQEAVWVQGGFYEVEIIEIKEDKVYFYEGSHIVYDCHDMDVIMDELYGKEQWRSFPEEKVQEIYDNLPWESALVVYLEPKS